MDFRNIVRHFASLIIISLHEVKPVEIKLYLSKQLIFHFVFEYIYINFFSKNYQNERQANHS